MEGIFINAPPPVTTVLVIAYLPCLRHKTYFNIHRLRITCQNGSAHRIRQRGSRRSGAGLHLRRRPSRPARVGRPLNSLWTAGVFVRTRITLHGGLLVQGAVRSLAANCQPRSHDTKPDLRSGYQLGRGVHGCVQSMWLREELRGQLRLGRPERRRHSDQAIATTAACPSARKVCESCSSVATEVARTEVNLISP